MGPWDCVMGPWDCGTVGIAGWLVSCSCISYRRLQYVCHREAKSWFRLIVVSLTENNRIIHIRKAVAFSDFTFLLQTFCNLLYLVLGISMWCLCSKITTEQVLAHFFSFLLPSLPSPPSPLLPPSLPLDQGEV